LYTDMLQEKTKYPYDISLRILYIYSDLFFFLHRLKIIHMMGSEIYAFILEHNAIVNSTSLGGKLCMRHKERKIQ
jgi:hypothetical protein